MAGMNEPGADAGSETTAADPFQGNARSISWTRPVNIAQLQAEVDQALGAGVRLAFTSPGEEVSADAPATVFVTPSSADLDAVKQVLAAHRPDPHFGMGEEDRRLMQVQDKLRKGAALTMADVQLALRALLI